MSRKTEHHLKVYAKKSNLVKGRDFFFLVGGQIMSRKALIIGIDNYPNSPLTGCVNDATEMASLLNYNEDGSKNFDVVLEKNISSKERLFSQIQKLYSGDDEIALLYFSGHGTRFNETEYLCTPDGTKEFPGVNLSDILRIINTSKCKNKIVILDSCFSGGMGDNPLSTSTAALVKGTTILSACKSNECSVEIQGHGLFTSLLISALKGGAADLCGNITPGALYAYVDKALGSWEQRPLFKTNVQEFISLRQTKPKLSLSDLRALKTIFSTSKEVNLDPSFEYTNIPQEKHDCIKPYATEANVKTFKLLQRLESVGLVEPVGTPHMYFAAMESRSCKLTALGEYYFILAKRGRI